MAPSTIAAQRSAKIQLLAVFGAGVLSWFAPSCQHGERGGLSFEDFWNDYATIYCSIAVNCGAAEPSYVDDCVAELNRPVVAAGVKAQVAVGTLSYDSAAATECLAAFRAATAAAAPNACAEPALSWSPPCYKMLTLNAVDSGSPCLDSQASSSSCKEKTDVCAGPRCNQTCQPSGALGQPCTSGYSCNPGYYCDTATQTCATPLPAGSPCTIYGSCDSSSYCDMSRGLCMRLPVDGEPCASATPPCAAGAYCPDLWGHANCRAYIPLGGTCGSTACVPFAYCDGSNTCVARKASGVSCTVGKECEENLICMAGRCATPSTEGGPCATRDDCRGDLTCDLVLRTCQPFKGVSEEGEACTGYALKCNWDGESGPEFRCDGAATNPYGGVGTMGACRWPHLGDACTGNRNCPLRSYCDRPDGGTSGVCRSSALGTPCDYRVACQPEQYCAQGHCQARGPRGTACTYSSECAATLTCRINPNDGSSACGDRGSSGSPCAGDRDDQCKLPNLCIAGVCTPATIIGTPCGSYGSCFTGLCRGRNPDAGISGMCEPYLEDGAPCLESRHCSSLSCVKGVCVAACG